MDLAERASERAAMVERQLRRRGIGDERVLAAIESVPREAFVPEPERRRAYDDHALPIGHGQTISQPWVVAAIVQALELAPSDTVLEIGTGSGYSAAVIAQLAAVVISVERIGPLARDARHALAECGIANVEVLVADGSVGHPDRAPYDAIAVHAAAPYAPPSLIDQLAPGGRLVVPVTEPAAGPPGGADLLTAFTRTDAGLRSRTIGPCRFVPLIGDEGYEAS